MAKINSGNGIGQRVRDIRLMHGISLRTLAEKSSLNVNTLSLIENDKTSPSVNTLQLIATALGEPLTIFFSIPPEKTNVAFQKSSERSKSSFRNGFLEDLSVGVNLQCGKPLFVTIRPRTNSGPVPLVHTGYEFIYCIEGKFEYTIEAQHYLLETGDSLLFEAPLPHGWQNPGSDSAKLLLLFYLLAENDHAIERHF